MDRIQVNYCFIGYCLLSVALLNFGMAFFMLWSVTPGLTLFEHLEHFLPAIVDAATHVFPEFLQVVVLPLLVGLLCLIALVIVLLAPPSPRVGRNAFLLPLIPTGGMVIYSLVAYGGLHPMVFTLLTLILAWWVYHKPFRCTTSSAKGKI